MKPLNPRFTAKEDIEVEFILDDGTRLSGNVFIEVGQRVLDLLNEPAPFLPIRVEGEILLVKKSSIAICKPLDSPG